MGVYTAGIAGMQRQALTTARTVWYSLSLSITHILRLIKERAPTLFAYWRRT
jgi:hypothetical protein